MCTNDLLVSIGLPLAPQEQGVLGVLLDGAFTLVLLVYVDLDLLRAVRAFSNWALADFRVQRFFTFCIRISNLKQNSFSNISKNYLGISKTHIWCNSYKSI